MLQGCRKRTLHCLRECNVSQSEFRIPIHVSFKLPVKILCGHDCNLCAPPIASSVFCPGFNPLNYISVSERKSKWQIPPPNSPPSPTPRNSQMISIVQTKPTTRLLKLLRSQALETSLGSDGHEDGQLDRAMWKVQDCCPGFGSLFAY